MRLCGDRYSYGGVEKWEVVWIFMVGVCCCGCVVG